MKLNFLVLTKQELIRLLASFILGLVIGSSLLNLWVGRRLDQLIYEKKQLIGTINAQKTRLNNLEESLEERRKMVIQELKINLSGSLDKHQNQKLEEKIFNLLNTIIGQSIKQVDGKLIAENLEDRTIVIEQNRYQLNLNWIIIRPTTIIELEVTSKDDS